MPRGGSTFRLRPDIDRPRLGAQVVIFLLLVMVLESARASAASVALIPEAPAPMAFETIIDGLAPAHLSEAQAYAVQHHFDRYDAAFATLNDTIGAELKHKRNTQYQGFILQMSREHFSGVRRLFITMSAHVSALEDELFDAIEVILADVQRPAVARLRVQREISRAQGCYAQHLKQRHPCTMISLRAFVDMDTIPPASRNAARDLLDAYELELARLSTQLCDHLAGYLLDVHDTVRAAGFSVRSLNDRAERYRAYHCNGLAMQKNELTSREWTFRIATLHRRTLHELEALVYPQDLTAVRNAFTDAAYIGLFREAPTGREALDVALGGTVALPRDVQRALEDIRENYIAQRRSLEDSAMAMYDEVARDPTRKFELRPARRAIRLERQALELETAERITDLLRRLDAEQNADRDVGADNDMTALDASDNQDR
jgi:hypothetical protein